MLKEKHLEKGIRNAIDLAPMLLDEQEISITEFASMVYDLCETGVTGEESVEESSYHVSGNAEESEEELVNPVAQKDLMTQLKEVYGEDDILQRIIAAKVFGQRKIPHDLVKDGVRIELGDCEIYDDMLYVGKRVYVPDNAELKTRIIKDIHEPLPGGHAGRSSTYDRVSSHYYWPRMTDTIARYVKSCHACKRSKAYREGKHGLLKPLPIPDRYWQDISVDFITPLPICSRFGRRFEHIMVVVDRLSKKKKFIPLELLKVEAVV